jgi:Tol biopolymer transport system component/DNA-binding winged helix-turn-helix (wHTH) protein
MPSLSELPRVLRFGLFEVDLRAHELRRGGVKLKLQEQPFEVLSLLLERPGEVVTREELRDRLWPADTFVDFDHSVNAAIKRLRDALGDSADNPRFVETLARRGYRFIAQVENGDGGRVANGENGYRPAAIRDRSATTSQIGVATPEARSVSGRTLFTRIALLGLIVIVATVSIGIHSWRSRSPLASRPEMRVVPITSSPGAEIQPHFSPDGKEIAFISEAENGRTADLFVKLIGGDSPVRLAQDLGLGSALSWSPDGRYIAFGRCPGPSGIWIIPALGGTERKLVDHYAYGCEFQGLSWSPDGKSLTLAGKPSPDEGWSIYRFSLETHEETRLTFPPPHTVGDHIPAFSPDGSRIAFRRISSPHVTDIYVVASEGGEPKRITFDRAFVQDLTWTPDSKSIVYAGHRLGTTGLWKVPATAGGVVEAIPIAGPMAGSPAVSLERNRLAYTQGFLHREIWRVERSLSGKTTPAAPFISSSWGDGAPQFSPDGKKVVFYSARSGAAEIWRCNSDGSDPIQLTSLGVLSGSPRWSPDGTKIVFDSRPAEHSQILVVDADGGFPQQITSGNYDNSVPNWSRDGKWIYFGSNRSGNWQLWKVSVLGGDPIRLTKNNGFFAIESHDGGTIYYTKEDTDGIWQMPVSGGDAKRIVDGPLTSWGDWAVRDEGIYFINFEGATLPSKVRFYDFGTRKLSTIARLHEAIVEEEENFDISPDGKWILYGRVNKSVDIMMVENFR